MPSRRRRGARAAKTAVSTNAASTVTEALSEYAQRAKAAWARLIRKVYEADPLQCSKCEGPMRVIALIEDPVKGEAEFSRMFRKHSHRRTGATDFVAPWTAIGNPFALLVLYREVRMSRAQG